MNTPPFKMFRRDLRIYTLSRRKMYAHTLFGSKRPDL